MPNTLDPNLVKSGQVVPKPGDFVNGYAYVQGDPRANTSYRPLQGNDYLGSIPPDRANLARAVLSGHAPYPTLGRNNKYNQQIVEDVLAAEPDFDATAYKRRVDMIHDFTSGKTSQLIRALNQAPLHALSLAGAYDQLHNFDGPQTVNNMLTDAQAAMGDKRQLAGRGSFNEAQPAVSDELATLYTGKPATIEGAREQQNAFQMGAGPTEANSALATASELMRDRLETIQTQWNNGMGTQANLFPIISPRSKAALDQLYSRYHPQAAAPAQASGKPAPKGVDPNIWTHMTPQEQSLWH